MEKQIYNYLLKKGCCKACGLRYLRDKEIDFDNLDEYIKKKDLITNGSLEHDGDDVDSKKCKSNPCTICLGLLQDYGIDEIVNNVLLSEVQKYDTAVFTCSISIPAATLIREHTMRLMLQNKFSEFYEKEVDEIPLNKTWKLIMKNRLSEKLNMNFENSNICNFSINIIMDYEDNNQELKVLHKLTLTKKKDSELYSRKFICNLLANVSSHSYKDVVKFPPEIPTKHLNCKLIECKHNSVFLAGRYCKFSRDLSQSPWIIDGVRTMETSVEEIIFEQLSKLFSIPILNLKFSASGREDCDVRCLGKGRPFYIEILDPKKTKFSFDELRNVESKINESSLIKVRDLQSVERSELSKIKEGEQLKTKDYIALCYTKEPITQEQINKINCVGSLVIKQKTPIRVLHRRPLAVRNRKINKIKANLLSGKENLFTLHVETEAGTYIKEFVHGDFGRTKPSLGSIINNEVDIVALDVMSINLNWPKEIVAEEVF